MTDTERLRAVQESLAADGYSLEVTERGGRLGAIISAGPDTCAECLVPKELMRAILGQALGIDEQTIDLSYPSEVGSDGGPQP